MIDVSNYNKHAAENHMHPLIDYGGLISGFWLQGNNYQNKSRLYGAYPPSYLKRMKLLFPNEDLQILHLFAGDVQKGTWRNETTVDIRPDFKPDIQGNAEYLSELWKWWMLVNPVYPDVILADPPYDDNHKEYGTEKVRKTIVIKECSKILKQGGYLVWLDTIIPIWAKASGYKLRGTIGMIQSTNHKCRVITILEKAS